MDYSTQQSATNFRIRAWTNFGLMLKVGSTHGVLLTLAALAGIVVWTFLL